MALRQRTITGTVVGGDGVAINGGLVTFKLTESLGYTGTHIVVDREFTAITNSSGVFTKSLWCDEDSLTPINYAVTFPVEDNGASDPKHSATISFAYEDGSTKDIGTLMAESADVTDAVSGALLTFLAAYAASAVTPAVNPQTGTTYTLLASDSTKWLTFNNASGIIVTVPASLGAGFNCIIQQIGVGQVTVVGSGTTVHNVDSQLKCRARYGILTLFAYAANTFVLTGNTAA